MSLADYNALKTAIQSDWLKRTDITSQVPDFIQLFESDFNSEMRVRQMQAETSQISTAGYLLHPTNWLSWKEIRGSNGGRPYNLEFVTDEIAVKRTSGDSGLTRFAKVTGSRTYLYPSTGGTFPTKYYEGVALTSGTNWLLTRYPGAYLYGSLLQFIAFGGHDPRESLWFSAYSAIIEKIKADSRKSEWSGQAQRLNLDITVI